MPRASAMLCCDSFSVLADSREQSGLGPGKDANDDAMVACSSLADVTRRTTPLAPAAVSTSESRVSDIHHSQEL